MGMVNAMSQLLYPREIDLVSLVQEAGGPRGQSGRHVFKLTNYFEED